MSHSITMRRLDPEAEKAKRAIRKAIKNLAGKHAPEILKMEAWKVVNKIDYYEYDLFCMGDAKPTHRRAGKRRGIWN